MRLLLIILLVIPLVAGGEEPERLTADSFARFGDQRGVVLIGINWNRMWDCGGYENAQLHRISFLRLQQDGGEQLTHILDFTVPRRLPKTDYFTEYRVLLDPGEYALSSFDIKVAESVSHVRHLLTGADQLLKGGEPLGGTFSVFEREIVYVGHFELDCVESPIPWRYYIDDRGRFESFVSGLRHEFPFLEETPAHYRLFSTTQFGLEFSLDELEDE